MKWFFLVWCIVCDRRFVALVSSCLYDVLLCWYTCFYFWWFVVEYKWYVMWLGCVWATMYTCLPWYWCQCSRRWRWRMRIHWWWVWLTKNHYLLPFLLFFFFFRLCKNIPSPPLDICECFSINVDLIPGLIHINLNDMPYNNNNNLDIESSPNCKESRTQKKCTHI